MFMDISDGGGPRLGGKLLKPPCVLKWYRALNILDSVQSPK